MSKQPFTDLGITAKQNELHALSSTALKQELDQLRASFSTWISTNFDLNPAQAEFLNSVDPAFITAIVPEIIASLEHKFPIEVILPPRDKPPLGSKLMVKEKSLKYKYDSVQGLQISGQLAITLAYSG